MEANPSPPRIAPYLNPRRPGNCPRKSRRVARNRAVVGEIVGGGFAAKDPTTLVSPQKILQNEPRHCLDCRATAWQADGTCQRHP